MKDKETAKWLWKETSAQHKYIYILICTDIVISVLGVGFALLVRRLVDTAAAGGKFIVYAVILLATVMMQYSLHAFRLYLTESTETRLTNQLRSGIIHNLIYADYAQTMNHHSGKWMNHLFSDVKIVAGGFTGILPDTAGMITRLLSACAALLFLEPLFFIIYFAAGIVLIVVISRLRKRVKILHKDMQKKEDGLHAFLQELLENILIIKTFRAYDYVEARTQDYQELYRESRLKKRIVSILANVSFSLLFEIGYVIALIWGAYGLYSGTVTYGSLMAVLQLVLQVRLPISRLSNVMTRSFETLASSERIRTILRSGKEISSQAEPLDFSRIVLEDISFNYDRDLVLDHADLEIHKGEKVALTGTSGGGKSTLFMLMMKMLKPTEGRVLVYGAGGDIFEEPDGLLFAYVPQGNALFSGSIADNITFGRPYDEGKIREVLKISSADQFISMLPDGIHTDLNEGGSGLSEGQMQRIAIARALYSEAPILLLDESTSALDERTEAQLLANLGKLDNRTIVIVTHRKAALSICDSVYELTGGHLSRC